MKLSAMTSVWIGVVSLAFLTITSSPVLAADDNVKGIYKGTIQKVDMTKLTVDVLKGTTTKSFIVDKSTDILTKEKPQGATLKDLRSGFYVEVAYTEEEKGLAMASSIKETDKTVQEPVNGKPIPPVPHSGNR